LWRSSSSADLQGRSWSSQRNACLCWAASSAESTANVSLGTSNGRPCSSTRDVQQLWEVAFFRSEKINANPCRKYSPVPETGLARFESLTCSCQDKVYNTNFIMSYCVLHRARILSQKLQSGSALASAWIVLLMPVFLLSTAIEGKGLINAHRKMDLTQSLVELRDTLYTWVTRKLALSQGSRPRRIMKSFVSRTISLLLPTCFTGFVVRVCVLVYVLQLASVPEAMWKKHWRHFVAYSQGGGLQGFINQAMFVLTSSAVSMGDITKECVLSAAALTREELWRLFTSAVFHVNLIHLLSNMHAFSEIGTFVEKSYGTWRYVSLILVSCLSGNIFSLCLNDFYVKQASCGFSTALYGLMAAWVTYLIFESVRERIRNAEQLRKRREEYAAAGYPSKELEEARGDDAARSSGNRASSQIIPAMVALAINAVISTQFQFIDAWAHLGGFVGGLVLSSLYLTISCLSLRLARC